MILCLSTDRADLGYLGEIDRPFLLFAFRVRVVSQLHGVWIKRVKPIQSEPSLFPVLQGERESF